MNVDGIIFWLKFFWMTVYSNFLLSLECQETWPRRFSILLLVFILSLLFITICDISLTSKQLTQYVLFPSLTFFRLFLTLCSFHHIFQQIMNILSLIFITSISITMFYVSLRLISLLWRFEIALLLLEHVWIRIIGRHVWIWQIGIHRIAHWRRHHSFHIGIHPHIRHISSHFILISIISLKQSLSMRNISILHNNFLIYQNSNFSSLISQ